jgi:hypothetical protein
MPRVLFAGLMPSFKMQPASASCKHWRKARNCCETAACKDFVYRFDSRFSKG